MSSALAKRLDRLEALLASRIATPIWRWSYDEVNPAVELERMVADGEIAAKDVARVTLWRWLTPTEAVARGMEMPPDPPAPRPHVPAQLPAPEERKLLAAPVSPSCNTEKNSAQADEPDDPFTRVRAVPPQPPKKEQERFHWPVIYPPTWEGV